MPYKEKKIERSYYSIGEVAEMLGVSTSLIRFWENEFDVIKPKKNKKGNRQYTREDITVIQKVYQLVKEQGYTLNGAKEAFKSDKKPATPPPTPEKKEIQKTESIPANNNPVIETLVELKAFLIDLRDRL